MRRRRLAWFGGAIAVCLLAPVAAIPLSGSATAADYPTWDDVSAAKQDAAVAQQEVSRIQGLLDDLDAEARRLGDASVTAAARAQTARAQADEAERAVTALTTQAADATRRADAASRQAGVLSTRLTRGGDPSLTLWFSAGAADDTLQRLAGMDRVLGSLDTVRDGAEAERTLAQALGRQAEAARSARDSAAAEAETRAAEAERARAEADARVADAQARSSTLLAQLALLNDTSAELEAGYRQGRALAESYRAPAAPSSPSQPASPSAPSSPIPVPVAPGDGSLSPAEARNYAAGRVGARGWSGGEQQCLVSLWNRESGWRWNALNPSSGAYGIPQALPGSKMAASGSDWQTNARTQIDWGLGYIAGRYGSPCGAWAHSESRGWY